MSDKTVSENAIVIERTFDAPTDVIWQMWTQPEHFQNWYGPQGFTVPVAQMDVKVGGKRLVCMEMQMPDRAMKMWTMGEYLEVVPTERLVYTDIMADENGNPVSPTAYGMDDSHPTTTQVTVLLEAIEGGTKMTMTHAGVPKNEQGANEGWNQSFTKLENYVETVHNK